MESRQERRTTTGPTSRARKSTGGSGPRGHRAGESSQEREQNAQAGQPHVSRESDTGRGIRWAEVGESPRSTPTEAGEGSAPKGGSGEGLRESPGQEEGTGDEEGTRRDKSGGHQTETFALEWFGEDGAGSAQGTPPGGGGGGGVGGGGGSPGMLREGGWLPSAEPGCGRSQDASLLGSGAGGRPCKRPVLDPIQLPGSMRLPTSFAAVKAEATTTPAYRPTAPWAKDTRPAEVEPVGQAEREPVSCFKLPGTASNQGSVLGSSVRKFCRNWALRLLIFVAL